MQMNQIYFPKTLSRFELPRCASVWSFIGPQRTFGQEIFDQIKEAITDRKSPKS